MATLGIEYQKFTTSIVWKICIRERAEEQRKSHEGTLLITPLLTVSTSFFSLKEHKLNLGTMKETKHLKHDPSP